MNEEKIREIEQNMIEGIDKEAEQMAEIEMLATSITNRLILMNHTREKFMGTDYIFTLSFDKSTKEIVVMRTDPIKFKIAGFKYKPGIFKAYMDESFTFEENVFMVVKAALCSKAGLIKVDEMSDKTEAK